MGGTEWNGCLFSDRPKWCATWGDRYLHFQTQTTGKCDGHNVPQTAYPNRKMICKTSGCCYCAEGTFNFQGAETCEYTATTCPVGTYAHDATRTCVAFDPCSFNQQSSGNYTVQTPGCRLSQMISLAGDTTDMQISSSGAANKQVHSLILQRIVSVSDPQVLSGFPSSKNCNNLQIKSISTQTMAACKDVLGGTNM